MEARLERLIQEIYKLQTPHMDGKSGQPSDILIVRTQFNLSLSPLFYVLTKTETE